MKIKEEEALPKIAAYCSKAERSQYDVKRKLESWELEEEAIERILKRLKSEKFLDENRFCRAFIKDKIQFNKWGKTKIVFELKKKYVPEQIIKDCFEDFESDIFEEPLLKLLQTKIKSVKANDEYERKMKLTRFALGRGYSYDLIKKCLSKLMNASDDEYFEPFP